MPYNPSLISRNIRDMEYNKYTEIYNDTRFPPVTSVLVSYDSPTTTQTNIYNKVAELVYVTNVGEISSAPVFNTNAQPFGDNSATDAFGKLRVSLPNTLFDSKFIYDKLPEVYDEKASLGASNFLFGDSCVTMQTSATGGYVIRQTRARFNYQPGKSMAAVFSFVASPEINIVKRVGLFQGLSSVPYTPDDGLFLEVGSNGPSFNVVKTQGTSAGTITAPQSAWNIDPMNGYGSSGINIDFTKAQVLAIDYEWLGVGRVRFGFYLEGKLYYAHEVTNLNTLIAPYITSPNQAVRYEIRQTGPGTGLMTQICSTVIDEGVSELIGSSITAYTSAAVTVQNNIMTPIIAVRANPNFDNTVILLKSLDIYNTDNTTDIQIIIYRNPTTNKGLQWYTANGSQMQYALGTNAITVSGGFELYSTFAPRSQGTGAGTALANLPGLLGRFGANIDGTPETLIIGGKGLGATATVYVALNAIQQS